MKKRRIAILGAVCASVLCLSSCLLKNKDLTINKEDLSYTFTDSDWENVKSQMTRFENAITEGGALYDVVGAWNAINNDGYALATYRSVEYINYCMGDSEAHERYTDLQDKLNEIVKFEESMYQPIYDSKFRDTFYANYTEEEITKLLNSVKPDEYYELEAKDEEMLASYREKAKADDYSDASTTYLALVKNYEKEAEYCGYDNYLEYAYEEVYSREYEPEDTVKFNGYVKDYIVPLMEYSYDKCMELKTSMTEDEKNEYKSFSTDSFTEYKDTFDGYAAFLGEDYLENYNFLWNKGYMKVGETDSCYQGAFTQYLYMSTLDQPIMYFGPGYQNILTLVHEFGHYNAFMIHGAGALSYDLAETQSQGDEVLFTAWMFANGKMSNSASEFTKYAEIFNLCETVVLASEVNALEYKVYNSDDLTESELDALVMESFEDVGGYETISSILGEGCKDYWKKVVLDNPGYYISYAMSCIPTLEIYEEALTSISMGRKLYMGVYDYSSSYDGTDFEKILTAAGLSNPLTEAAFEKIIKLKEE